MLLSMGKLQWRPHSGWMCTNKAWRIDTSKLYNNDTHVKDENILP